MAEREGTGGRRLWALTEGPLLGLEMSAAIRRLSLCPPRQARRPAGAGQITTGLRSGHRQPIRTSPLAAKMPRWAGDGSIRRLTRPRELLTTLVGAFRRAHGARTSTKGWQAGRGLQEFRASLTRGREAWGPAATATHPTLGRVARWADGPLLSARLARICPIGQALVEGAATDLREATDSEDQGVVDTGVRRVGTLPAGTLVDATLAPLPRVAPCRSPGAGLAQP